MTEHKLKHCDYSFNHQSQHHDDLWYSVCACRWLQWRHNERDGISNHQPHHCLLNHLFRRRSKKTSKLCVTGLCAGNSPVTGEFPAQMASNVENVSIWWRHHVNLWPSWMIPYAWNDIHHNGQPDLPGLEVFMGHDHDDWGVYGHDWGVQGHDWRYDVLCKPNSYIIIAQ